MENCFGKIDLVKLFRKIVLVAETFLRKDLLASARRRPFWKTVFGKLFLGNCLWKIVGQRLAECWPN